MHISREKFHYTAEISGVNFTMKKIKAVFRACVYVCVLGGGGCG